MNTTQQPRTLTTEECDICRYGPHKRDPKPATKANFQHEGEAAAILRDAFIAQGFSVDWDGTETRAVTVEF